MKKVANSVKAVTVRLMVTPSKAKDVYKRQCIYSTINRRKCKTNYNRLFKYIKITVSYTHLAVHKRQIYSRLSNK